jgi:thiosulfate/3-mercaptopyruvate sulfurtransferase
MKTLVSAPDLRQRAAGAHAPVLLDCSFDLTDPEAGQRAYRDGHPPGAHYLHLESDLSAPPRDAAGRFRGRHPLPAREDWARTLGRLGIGPATPVVAYDAQGGAYAARAWWMLRWMGHEDVAVLDGGLAAWREAGGALESGDGPAVQPSAPYPLHAPACPTLEAAQVQAQLGRVRLIDARAPERFRGDVEPLDRAAGHIPGALNRFFRDNLAADGRFKPRAQLRAEWAPLVAGDAMAVLYCGSGVTACHNLLAMAHAGFEDGVLYPGSWSEWSDDPARPQARGGPGR